MINYTCIGKEKESGVITKLKLKDLSTGSIITKDSKSIKDLLLSKTIFIDNVSLDSKGRFVIKQQMQLDNYEDFYSLLCHIKKGLQKDNENVLECINLLKRIKEGLHLTSKDLKSLLENTTAIKNIVLTIKGKNNDNFEDLKKKQKELSLQLQACQNKIDTLLQEVHKADINNESSFDKLERLLEEQNTNFEKFDKEMKEKISYLFSRQPRDFYGTLKYPRPETDVHKYNTFYEKDMTLDEESFNKISKKYKYKSMLGQNNYVELDNPFLNDFNYDDNNKKILDTLRLHLETVHLIRDNMESVYFVDLKSERTEQYDQRNGAYYTGFMASYGGFIGGLAEDFKNVNTDKDGQIIGNLNTTFDLAFFGLGALMGLHFIPYMFNFIKLGTKHVSNVFTKNDRYRIGELRTVEERNIGSYNYTPIVLTVIDNQDLLLQDENTNTIYGSDIRMFVINSNNLKVKRNLMDGGTTRIFDALKRTKDKDNLFYQVAKGSICSMPIESDRLLMKFYVDFYLSVFLDINEETRITDYQDISDNKLHFNKNFRIKHKDVSVTEANVNTRKIYFDLFCNAYFSAKRLLNFNVDLLNYLDDKVKITQDNSNLIDLYIQFLRYLYFGLIMQSVKSNMSIDLIRKFLDSTKFTGSDYIMNILFE